jgi:hypothetical protein
MGTKKQDKPKGIIFIPRFNSDEKFDRNQEKASDNNNDACPCCGKEILNPKFFINSIYGGGMYPKADKNEYADAWVMGVGSECRKKLPAEYVMTESEL